MDDPAESVVNDERDKNPMCRCNLESDSEFGYATIVETAKADIIGVRHFP